MPLAELNIAVVRAPMDSQIMRDFADGIASVNEQAETSPGFIWRYIDGTGDHEDYAPTPWDDQTIVNMSLWQDADSLKGFVFGDLHASFIKRRKEWFHGMTTAHFCLWELPEGELPTLADAKRRLDHLQAQGPCEVAFGWKDVERFCKGD